MIIFLRIALIVYLLAINFYSFLLVKKQRDEEERGERATVKDGKLFVAGFLGGASGIYIALLVFKYRLQSLFLMVFMPVLILANAFLVVQCFISDFFLPVQNEVASFLPLLLASLEI